MSSANRCREVLWRRTFDNLGFERARLWLSDSGAEISGTVFLAEQGAPLSVEYRIACNAEWRTGTVEIEQAWRGERRALRLEHDGQGHWRKDGADAQDLAGCTDVDLGVTPSTNALPVNRLRLPVRGRSEILAAWVHFPELEVTAGRQSYERLAKSQYRYTSVASGFTAVVEVDGDGLPIDYEGIWRRVATGPGVPSTGD